MERRDFLKACAATAAAASTPAVPADARVQTYARAKLIDESGRPILAKAIPVNRNLVFNYPYESTPCFLLNLGKPTKGAQLRTVDKQPYEWKGGVGPGRSIVAYSAICAHKLSYPTRDISFISFRAEQTPVNKHGAVIHCCSEHSQYDPAEGARVVAGPAPQPLAAILLEHDSSTDEIHAVGTLGGEMFNEFFAKYEFKLAMDYGGAPRRAAAGSCVVRPLENYCRQQVKC